MKEFLLVSCSLLCNGRDLNVIAVSEMNALVTSDRKFHSSAFKNRKIVSVLLTA
jgi:hypothetical protein